MFLDTVAKDEARAVLCVRAAKGRKGGRSFSLTQRQPPGPFICIVER